MNLSCEMKQHGFISQVLEMRKQVETHNKKPADIQGRDPPSHSYSKPLLVNDTPISLWSPNRKIPINTGKAEVPNIWRRF